MKIIKKGRDQKGSCKEFVCTGRAHGGGGCGAILLVSRDDLKEEKWGTSDDGYDYYWHFECPCCGVCTRVGVSNW